MGADSAMRLFLSRMFPGDFCVTLPPDPVKFAILMEAMQDVSAVRHGAGGYYSTAQALVQHIYTIVAEAVAQSNGLVVVSLDDAQAVPANKGFEQAARDARRAPTARASAGSSTASPHQRPGTHNVDMEHATSLTEDDYLLLLARAMGASTVDRAALDAREGIPPAHFDLIGPGVFLEIEAGRQTLDARGNVTGATVGKCLDVKHLFRSQILRPQFIRAITCGLCAMSRELPPGYEVQIENGCAYPTRIMRAMANAAIDADPACQKALADLHTLRAAYLELAEATVNCTPLINALSHSHLADEPPTVRMHQRAAYEFTLIEDTAPVKHVYHKYAHMVASMVLDMARLPDLDARIRTLLPAANRIVDHARCPVEPISLYHRVCIVAQRVHYTDQTVYVRPKHRILAVPGANIGEGEAVLLRHILPCALDPDNMRYLVRSTDQDVLYMLLMHMPSLIEPDSGRIEKEVWLDCQSYRSAAQVERRAEQGRPYKSMAYRYCNIVQLWRDIHTFFATDFPHVARPIETLVFLTYFVNSDFTSTPYAGGGVGLTKIWDAFALVASRREDGTYQPFFSSGRQPARATIPAKLRASLEKSHLGLDYPNLVTGLHSTCMHCRIDLEVNHVLAQNLIYLACAPRLAQLATGLSSPLDIYNFTCPSEFDTLVTSLYNMFVDTQRKYRIYHAAKSAALAFDTRGAVRHDFRGLEALRPEEIARLSKIPPRIRMRLEKPCPPLKFGVPGEDIALAMVTRREWVLNYYRNGGFVPGMAVGWSTVDPSQRLSQWGWSATELPGTNHDSTYCFCSSTSQFGLALPAISNSVIDRTWVRSFSEIVAGIPQRPAYRATPNQ